MKPGQHVGPYVIEEPLSHGAMGELHRARNQQTGDIVALKTVSHALRANLRGLRREIRALQSVDHPNVVQILDSDVNSSPPWYAMELIDGLALSKHWTVVPLERRWKTYLSAFADICDGLAFVHGVGLVHRDLKPGNIVLRTSHRTVGEGVVVDFGLATVSGGGIGREQIYKRSEVVGTPQYISPEQVNQGHVDPRTDLYALGCMLYEAVVGRPPFTAEVPFVGMLKHVNEAPRIPREGIDRIPPELTRLIYALLEKQPQNRPGYASDVREILGTLGEVSDKSHKPPARTYLHRPEFVGREAFEREFDAVGARLMAGRGGVVVIRGPSGSGKSRVAIELVRRVQTHAEEHVEVLVSQSPNTATSAPLASLRAAFEEIADVCSERGERFARKILGTEGALLARHLPVLAGVPGVGEANPALVNPDLLEQSTLEALSAALERLAEQRPLVLALDDVQWADPLTRLWLDRLAVTRFWERAQLLLILVTRTQEGDDDLQGLTTLAGATLFETGALADDALAQMVESMTGVDEVPPEFFAALRVDAQGLPSRAAQWLNAAVGRDALVRQSGRWRFEGVPIEDADIHDTITATVSFEDLLAQRIQSLENEHRALLDLAAVLGPQLRPEVLAHLGETEFGPLDDLINDGILVDIGRGAVEFASSELHEVAKRRLGDRPRAELHVRAAAILDAVGAPVVEIAHHLALSGWRDEARKRLFVAADEAFDAGEWVEAQRRYHAASDLGFKAATAAVIGWSRIAILTWRHNDYDAAMAAIATAEAACDGDVRPIALAELARAKGLLARATDSARSLEELEKAREIFASIDEWIDERNVAVEVGNAHCRAGDFDAGRLVFTEIHDQARASGDDEGVAIALASVGATWISSRRYEAAADFLERAADKFRQLQTPHRLADALFNLAVCRVDRGQLNAGVEALREVVTLRQAAGDQRGAATAQSALGHALLADDQPAEALVHLDAALAVLERGSDRMQLAVALGYAGEAHGRLRQFSPAMDQLVKALSIHRALPYSQLEPYVHLEIAKLHRRLGLYEEARAQIEKARMFDNEDAYLDLMLRVEQAFWELATQDGAAVDIEVLREALNAMQLEASSAGARAVHQLERALHARPTERLFGELRQHLPPAFQE